MFLFISRSIKMRDGVQEKMDGFLNSRPVERKGMDSGGTLGCSCSWQVFFFTTAGAAKTVRNGREPSKGERSRRTRPRGFVKDLDDRKRRCAFQRSCRFQQHTRKALFQLGDKSRPLFTSRDSKKSLSRQTFWSLFKTHFRMKFIERDKGTPFLFLKGGI